MKKLYTVLIVFFLALPFCFAQDFLPKGVYRSPFDIGIKNVPDKSKSGKAKGNYFFIPVLGYENYVVSDNYSAGNWGSGFANTGLFGLDFMYVKKSGFAVWFNNTFFMGHGSSHMYRDTTYYGRPLRDEFESITDDIIGGWNGELLLGYSKSMGSHSFGFGAGFQTSIGADLLEFGALALRFDYSYFFNAETGITVCITDGLGGGYISEAGGFMNTFTFKLGPVFKL